MRSFILVCLLTLIATAAPAADGDSQYQPSIQEGDAARSRGDFAAAEAAYRRALATASEAQDDVWKYRSYFYLGLTKQQAAEAAEDEKRRDALYEEAEELYEDAHALKSDSGAALLNLAYVERANQDYADAAEWLEKGLALHDSLYLTFAEQLGDLYYSRLGDRAKAAARYRIAADAQPDGSTLHKKLIRALLPAKEEERPLVRETLDYLWSAYESARLDRALTGAVEVLESRSFPPKDEEEVITLIAAALAGKDYDALGFATSEVGGRLQQLGDDARHRETLAPLLSLYTNTNTKQWDPPRFGRWETLTSGSGAPLSGLAAIRELARSLGANAQRRSDYPRAEQLLLFAVRIGEDVDAAALGDLLSLYAAQNRIADIDRAVAEHIPKVRRESPEDRERLADLQTTLGLIYGSLPEKQRRSQEAIAQLLNAQSQSSDEMQPELHVWLADAYASVGNRTESNDHRFAAAEGFLRKGNAYYARRVLGSIPTDDIREPEQPRFDRLASSLVELSPEAQQLLDESQQRAVAGGILRLSVQPSGDERRIVTRELKALGVERVTIGWENGIFQVKKDGTLVNVSFKIPERLREGVSAVR